MHTSVKLRSSDFRYRRLEGASAIPAAFAAFCADYHELDRVGVVSRCLEDGVLYVGGALLALTTAFYDVLRAKGGAFFNYPQHFAFFEGGAEEIRTRAGRLPRDARLIGEPWGNLDVWPDSNWITAPGTVVGMLKTVFDFQVNRLFWPEDFLPEQAETLLPPHVRAIMRSRLKAVYYYDTAAPTIEVHGSGSVEDLVRRSIARLPGANGSTPLREAVQDDFPYVERFRQVGTDEFLNTMVCCFAEGDP